jgi:zinc/manganese transport system permease protein
MGTMMAVGLMMLPAVASRHWARELSGLVYAAVAIAALSAFAGLLASYHLDLPSGPAIVLTAGVLWAGSVVAGPVDGLAVRLIRRPHLAG